MAYSNKLYSGLLQKNQLLPHKQHLSPGARLEDSPEGLRDSFSSAF
jgi:hypothetical protein